MLKILPRSKGFKDKAGAYMGNAISARTGMGRNSTQTSTGPDDSPTVGGAISGAMGGGMIASAMGASMTGAGLAGPPGLAVGAAVGLAAYFLS